MILRLLPLGTDLRREANQIVAQSADRNLTDEEWAEVQWLRAEADRMDGGHDPVIASVYYPSPFGEPNLETADQ